MFLAHPFHICDPRSPPLCPPSLLLFFRDFRLFRLGRRGPRSLRSLCGPSVTSVLSLFFRFSFLCFPFPSVSLHVHASIHFSQLSVPSAAPLRPLC